MIGNSTTGSHDMYLHGRVKRPKRLVVRPKPEAMPGNPRGTFEERCLWMRARQQRKRARG